MAGPNDLGARGARRRAALDHAAGGARSRVRVTAHPLAARALRRRRPGARLDERKREPATAAHDCACRAARARAAVDYVLAGGVGGLASPTQIKDGRTGRALLTERA